MASDLMASEPVNILGLNSNGIDEFLDSFDHVFSDCDGVLWAGSPINGSGEFIKLMKSYGKTVHFVSNNSMRTKEEYEENFKACGIKDGFKNLTIPSVAIAEYLKSVNFNKAIYCVTCPEAIRILKSYGFKCKDGPDNAPDYSQDYVQYIEDDNEIGAVVLDNDIKVNFPKLYKVITYLQRQEVLFINGATDRHIMLRREFEPGRVVIGPGVFTQIVIDETKRQPIQIGKPDKYFGTFAMKRAGITDPSRILFIGDMIDQDVGLGKASGFKTLLVGTSQSKEEMMAHKTLRPDFYAKSLGSIVPFL